MTYNIVLKKTNKRGEAPLYVVFRIEGHKIEMPVKYSISPADFDKKKKQVKNTHPFCTDVNLIISTIISRINDIFVRYRLMNKRLTLSLFWADYRNPADYTSFYQFCNQMQQLRFQELSGGTQRHHKAIISKLQHYKKMLNFDDLTPEFFRRYILYLRNNLGNKEITINRNLKTISIYINEAVKMGYLKTNPIKEIPKRGFEEASATFLRTADVNKLLQLHKSGILNETYNQVLEFFLCMIFTSLHIGDARDLRIDQCRETEIIYSRKKLRNSKPRLISIPLSHPAKTILKKWIGQRTEGHVFRGLVCDVRVNM